MLLKEIIAAYAENRRKGIKAPREQNSEVLNFVNKGCVRLTYLRCSNR